TSTWFRAAGGAPLYNAANAVAIDAAGNAYLTGTFYGTVDFDPGPGTYNLTRSKRRGGDSSIDAFLWKITSAGSFVWAVALGGPKSDSGNAIHLDAAANVYVAGSFDSGPDLGSSTNDFDPGSGKAHLPTYGQGDIFIAKYTTNRN